MKKLDRPILAKGEATGHAHVLVANVAVYECEDGTREFELSEPTDLVHEEHKTIRLPDSVAFKSGTVKEFDPFTEETRRIAD